MSFAGGCQCGRVRYQADGPASLRVCYCRMCQKASGGPFMAFVRFPQAAVHWTTLPELFKSSNLVERGFCRECGTPLSYHEIGGPNINVTLNSLDDPTAIPPTASFAASQKPDWLDHLDRLPNEEIDLTGEAGFVNNQRG